MRNETKPSKPPRLESADVLMGRAMRDDAAAHRELANILHRAAMSADWAAVAEVRSTLAQMALAYESFAAKHDPEV